MTKQLMAGIDLHSNNMFCGIVDQDGKRVYEQELPCELPLSLSIVSLLSQKANSASVQNRFS